MTKSRDKMAAEMFESAGRNLIGKPVVDSVLAFESLLTLIAEGVVGAACAACRALVRLVWKDSNGSAS